PISYSWGANWVTHARPEDNPYLDAPGFGKPEELEVDFSQPVRRGPKELGFDYSYIIPASLDMAPYVYLENGKSTELADDTTEGIREGGVFWRGGEKGKSFDFLQVTPHLTEKVVEFLDGHAGNTQPFFLYFPLPSPHTPWMPTPEVEGASGAGKYGDFVVLVDRMVGRVAEALERNGFAENTLFIVTSDNGSDWRPEHIEDFRHHSNHEMLRGRKRDAWEGGHRV
ncbi:MAG: sulfatase-like hydrolase/transferase, partial [bacterium]|nr:sulfatase-like hydrolase/transferase [bacterium]